MNRDLRIASPCFAKWDEMQGDDRSRYCSHCNLTVYNFSAMTSAEVEELISAKAGRICARLYRRSDGTILTQDCPVGFRAKVRRVSRVAGAALSGAMSVLAAAQETPNKSTHSVQLQAEQFGMQLKITDSSGAVISRARITLTNLASEESLSTVPDNGGRAEFLSLKKGDYKLAVQCDGFQFSEQIVTISSDADIDIRLDVGVSEMGGPMFGDDAPVSSEEIDAPYKMR
jgi:hypothetical protein